MPEIKDEQEDNQEGQDEENAFLETLVTLKPEDQAIDPLISLQWEDQEV